MDSHSELRQAALRAMKQPLMKLDGQSVERSVVVARHGAFPEMFYKSAASFSLMALLLAYTKKFHKYIGVKNGVFCLNRQTLDGYTLSLGTEANALQNGEVLSAALVGDDGTAFLGALMLAEAWPDMIDGKQLLQRLSVDVALATLT